MRVEVALLTIETAAAHPAVLATSPGAVVLNFCEHAKSAGDEESAKGQTNPRETRQGMHFRQDDEKCLFAPTKTPRTPGMALDKSALWVINSAGDDDPRHGSEWCAVILRRGYGLDLQLRLNF